MARTVLAPLFFVLFTLVQCDNTKRNGEEIADALYKHSKECKDPSDGGIWAPLATGQSCGAAGHHCNYPSEWCSVRSTSKAVPQFNCVKLPEECKKALHSEEATTTPTTPAAPNTTEAATEATSANTPAEEGAAAATIGTTSGGEEGAETTENVETSTSASGEGGSASGEGGSAEVETPRPVRPRGRVGHGGGVRKLAETGRASVPAPAPAPAANCNDGHPQCCLWATHYQPGGSRCDSDAAFMRTNCAKSCGTCGCTAANFQTCQVHVNVEGCPYLRSGNIFDQTANSGPFSFPTAGGNRGQLSVPVSGGGTGPIVRTSGSSPVALPLGNPNGFGFNPLGINPGFGRGGPIAVPLGG